MLGIGVTIKIQQYKPVFRFLGVLHEITLSFGQVCSIVYGTLAVVVEDLSYHDALMEISGDASVATSCSLVVRKMSRILVEKHVNS
jgi:hypothetical protein